MTPPALSQHVEPGSEASSSLKSSRRKACNECKQQKLRCNLTSADDGDCPVCSRCQKLGLECKVESSFRRTRKRRRSYELEIEVRELKRQLNAYHANDTTALGVSIPSATAVDSDGARPPSAAVSPLQILDAEGIASNNGLQIPHARFPEQPVPGSNTIDRAREPGLTTKPVIDVPETHPISPEAVIKQPRTLENIELSVEEIDELFQIYFRNYHPFLPFINPETSPHVYYESSELLFWSIVSVASRRLQRQPTLLPRLARSVTSLLWNTIRGVPYSLQVIQSLLLLCTWPFPTSSSTADPTYMLSGIMVHLGSQMGLHRAFRAQDFTKIPLNLSEDEQANWVRTWEACNIVAQSVSVGCGVPAAVPLHDSPLPVVPSGSKVSVSTDPALYTHLRIEQFRHRVSSTLASNGLDPAWFASSRERLSLYRILNAVYSDLERETNAVAVSNITRFYLFAARLHLHAFYLFDDPTIDGYADRLVTLYETATTFVLHSLETENQDGGFFLHCPFFCYQVFLCASFIVLKIMMNGYFGSLIDAKAGKNLLNSAISALRKMSVANNDLPARLSDVIGYFCALPDHRAVSGETPDGLRLRVRNRLSMSIVYDSLWQWRRYFQMGQTSNEHNDNRINSQEELHSEFPPDPDQVDLGFGLPEGLADGTFNFDWPDIALDTPLQD